jgi:tetratricopeptide (TPR) repeat protein
VSGALGAEVEVDLPEELQADIRDFARRLPGLDCYAVIGVERGATPDDVRRAFFQRSKRYHPDRYFNRKTGAFGALLHEIYKRIVAAHELLRDPKLRVEYDKTLAPAPASPRAPAPRPAPMAGTASNEAEGSLRSRRGFDLRQRALQELRSRLRDSHTRAELHWQKVSDAAGRMDWSKAVRLLRLCLAYDPRETKYHDALAEFLPRAHEEQARDALLEADRHVQAGSLEAALPFLELAASLRPADADLAHRLADLLRSTGRDADKAIEFAERAVELDEGNVAYRKSLAFALRAGGRVEEARRELEHAARLLPGEPEIALELARLSPPAEQKQRKTR